MRVDKTIAAVVLIISVSVMLFSGIMLAHADSVHREAETAYAELASQIKKMPASPAKLGFLRPTDKGGEEQSGDTNSPQEEKPAVYVPDQGIDFAALKTINSDAVAWLYSPGTLIDYPVMKADDYNRYLHYLPNGTANANGSLFIDYNNAPDFSGRLTVIYGHNMKSKKMFGSLPGYKDQAYYDDHPYMYLYTEHGNYRIDLLYGFVIGAGQWRSRAFMYDLNTDELLAYAAHRTTFQSGAEYKDGDRIVALSTCSYEFDDARYVVIGILRVASE